MQTNSRYRGKVQVSFASDFASPYHIRRPTGVLGLDLALGGGFAAGGPAQVFGPGSAGKTHLVFRTAGEIQKNYGDDAVVGIACSEIRLDKGFARRSGFCVAYEDSEIEAYDAIRIANGNPPYTDEEKADLRRQVGQVIVLTGINGAELLDSTIDFLQYFKSRAQLLIVESLGALLTPEQEDKDVGEKTYGGSAGIITRWQNKSYPQFMLDQDDGRPLETTIMGINQVRANMSGGPHGPQTRAAAGAWSWIHAQLANVELKVGEPLWADSAHTSKTGHVVKWDIKKGKAGTHDGIRGEYLWHHMPQYNPVLWSEVEATKTEYGIDVVRDIVETARRMNVVRLGGAYLTFEDEVKPLRIQGDRNTPATEKLAQMLANDLELEQRVRVACLKASKLAVSYR
jgi:RecA/RadA recombinase